MKNIFPMPLIFDLANKYKKFVFDLPEKKEISISIVLRNNTSRDFFYSFFTTDIKTNLFKTRAIFYNRKVIKIEDFENKL